jgi:hypothetical protein
MEWCGGLVTKYKDGNQQYNKGIDSKDHNRRMNIGKVYKDFQGSSIIHWCGTLEL